MPNSFAHAPTVGFGSLAVQCLPGLRSSSHPGNSILPMTFGPKAHPQTALQLQDGRLELRGSTLRDGCLETALPGYPGDIAQDHHQRGCSAQMGMGGPGALLVAQLGGCNG